MVVQCDCGISTQLMSISTRTMYGCFVRPSYGIETASIKTNAPNQPGIVRLSRVNRLSLNRVINIYPAVCQHCMLLMTYFPPLGIAQRMMPHCKCRPLNTFMGGVEDEMGRTFFTVPGLCKWFTPGLN